MSTALDTDSSQVPAQGSDDASGLLRRGFNLICEALRQPGGLSHGDKVLLRRLQDHMAAHQINETSDAASSSNATVSDLKKTADAELDVCAVCGRAAHITRDECNEVKNDQGPEWIPHYSMLQAAKAGCVGTLKMYIDREGCMLDNTKRSVWELVPAYGRAQSALYYNAYTATCLGQCHEQIPGGQRECRELLRELLHAEKLLHELSVYYRALRDNANRNRLAPGHVEFALELLEHDLRYVRDKDKNALPPRRPPPPPIPTDEVGQKRHKTE